MVKGCTTTPKGAASVLLLISVSAALAACGGGGGGSGASSAPTAAAGTTSPGKVGLDLPPTISGAPLNAIVYGRTYTFVPTANDPQGDEVSFTIANKPAWASFDPGTGTLEGTPQAADVGSYPNITISVTDGLYAIAMRSFAISVVSSAAGSIMLSWDPPTQRDDGTPLTNLAGYKLYWGTALGHYPNLASIPNPGVATYVVDELPSGTYYLVATAYDSAGMESGYSNGVTETIP
jgi:putative Ig domain-containing protein